MKSNLVVVRALVYDVICLALEPNHLDLVVLASHQEERHELAKVRCGAARHVALMDLDACRET
jgi:hypothetical protein